MTIYVDVLFVLNFFITYLLLLFTSLFNRKSAVTSRFLISSAIGGLYSLVILTPRLNFLLTAVGKTAVSLLIVFVAFKFISVRLFAFNVLIFYFSNMLLLGIVMALWLLFKPDGIVINNNTVYFDIPAPALLFAGLFAYLAALLIIRIHNSSLSKKEIYSVTVYVKDEKIHLYAFADSGNKLKEPFSGSPVMIADESKMPFAASRVIPFSTVGGEGGLNAFKPDKIVIAYGKRKIETDRVYIAKSSINSSEYSAILNPEILKL